VTTAQQIVSQVMFALHLLIVLAMPDGLETTVVNAQIVRKIHTRLRMEILPVLIVHEILSPQLPALNFLIAFATMG